MSNFALVFQSLLVLESIVYESKCIGNMFVGFVISNRNKKPLEINSGQRFRKGLRINEMCSCRNSLKLQVEKYLNQKNNIRKSTEINLEYLFRKLDCFPEGKVFLRRRLIKIKPSDAKQLLADLQRAGVGFSELRGIFSLLKLSVQMAVDDGLLKKNPFDFRLSSVVRNDGSHREALTAAQRDSFLFFMKNDEYFSRYYDVFFVLFHTGLRISEFCGLMPEDIDFDGCTVSVSRQLQRLQRQYVVEETKTSCGTRVLPMTEDVKQCFERLVRACELRCAGLNPSGDITDPKGSAKSGFVRFLTVDTKGDPTTASHWEHRLNSAVDKYNRNCESPLPHITPHICRHTYCTLLAQQGVAPKTLQYLMGHSDISVTMNVYAHMDLEAAKAELKRNVFLLTKTDN